MTGPSGAGKTTLAQMLRERFHLPLISGSAASIKSPEERAQLARFAFPGGGHVGAIRFSALNPEFAWENMTVQLAARSRLIESAERFVTDRSPLDNIVFAVNQCGYSPLVTEPMLDVFFDEALRIWRRLDLVVYVRQVCPFKISGKASRVENRYYQRALDAQYEYWLREFFAAASGQPLPKVITLTQWDLDDRFQQCVAAVDEVLAAQ